MDKYTPPTVEVAMWVHWKYDPLDERLAAALVTAVGDQSITVTVFHRGFVNGKSISGVLHAEDPALKKRTPDNQNQSGCWQHTPLTEKLMALVQKAAPKRARELVDASVG